MKENETGTYYCKGGKLWSAIYWWAFLVVAVLAVPSVAFIVAALVPNHGLAQILVFVAACWVSTFIGMKLMKMSK